MVSSLSSLSLSLPPHPHPLVLLHYLVSCSMHWRVILPNPFLIFSSSISLSFSLSPWCLFRPLVFPLRRLVTWTLQDSSYRNNSSHGRNKEKSFEKRFKHCLPSSKYVLSSFPLFSVTNHSFFQSFIHHYLLLSLSLSRARSLVPFFFQSHAWTSSSP